MKILVDENLGAQLSKLGSDAVLYDASGRVLGYFSPEREPTSIEDMQLEPPLSSAEIEELRKVRTGKPLAEILARLGLQ